MSEKIEWINVYSTMDAFASNFRKDNEVGNAQYGIKGKKEVPFNLNYEIARREKYNLFSFLTLKHVTAPIVTGKQIGRASCRERVCLYV